MQKAEDPQDCERGHMLWVWPSQVPVRDSKVAKRKLGVGGGGTKVSLSSSTSTRVEKLKLYISCGGH